MVPFRLIRATTLLLAKPLGAAVPTAALYPPSTKNWPFVDAVRNPSDVEFPVRVNASCALAAVVANGSC